MMLNVGRWLPSRLRTIRIQHPYRFALLCGLVLAVMGVASGGVFRTINLFLQSSALDMAISFIGVLLFAGLTAYDTQRIKSMYVYVAGTQMMGKSVVMGALQLYLDFINMFLFLLRFMGNRD